MAADELEGFRMGPERALNRVAVCGLLLLGGCAWMRGGGEGRAADAAVYAVALDSLADAGTAPLVVRDSTVTLPRGAPVLNDVHLGLMGADSRMRAQLRERAARTEPLPRLPIRRGVKYASGGGGPGTGCRYEVSGVGYAADRRRAIVYVARRCGGQGGTGWLVLLRALPGGWRVQAAAVEEARATPSPAPPDPLTPPPRRANVRSESRATRSREIIHG
ncbi:MAG TPA: hypothetical protein VLK66_13780 [Longimicrobium sp.]|nr:hypothetical protein [Longimicrobium sp.]